MQPGCHDEDRELGEAGPSGSVPSDSPQFPLRWVCADPREHPRPPGSCTAVKLVLITQGLGCKVSPGSVQMPML